MDNQDESPVERRPSLSDEQQAQEAGTASLSRRNILAGVAAVGTAGVVSGAGTRAFFSDTEAFGNNQMTLGDLDLKLAWEATQNGQIISQAGASDLQNADDEEDFVDNTGPIFTIEDIEPGDSGEITTALHLFGNPGCVWLRFVGHDFDDNGLTVQESEAGDTTGGPGEGELQDYLDVSLWYDTNCNNQFDNGECEIASGPLGEVSSSLNDGVLLNALNFEVDGCISTCEAVGKIEFDDDDTVEGDWILDPDEDDNLEVVRDDEGFFTFFVDGEPVSTIDIEFYEEDGGQPTKFDFTVVDGAPICRVDVRGGPPNTEGPGSGLNSYDFPCVTHAEGLHAPERDDSGSFYGVSNFTFYYCPEFELECFENSTTFCIGLDWELPDDTPPIAETDSLAFELEFLAEQARHNPDPTNPWGGDER